jgi:hypothetical protein
MNNKDITRCLRLLLTFVVSIGAFVVCGGDKEEAPGTIGDGEMTDSMLIEEAMRSTLTRWRYLDKVALYEMEFEYIQDEYTIDEYLDQERIQRALVDSLADFRVTGITFYGHDSALLEDELLWLGRSGDTTIMPNKDMVYFHRGRWIRPTLGTSAGQKAYEEAIRVSDSAAAAEDSEGYVY